MQHMGQRALRALGRAGGCGFDALQLLTVPGWGMCICRPCSPGHGLLRGPGKAVVSAVACAEFLVLL